jgi:hypothetical protein
LRALGATEEQIRKACANATKDQFVVWDENWETVEMFLRLQTQWRISFAGPTGLDYAALDWLCRLYSVKDPATLFEGLQVMEVTALSCFNKKKS